jgi:peptide/nickel transport system permease protein
MSLKGLTPRFWVAAALVVFTVLLGVIGPLVVSVDPNATVGGLYDKPQCCGALILGTDNEGQSVISNLVYGTRTSLIVGLLAGLLATVIGLLVGLVAGYRGGWVDDVLTAVTNVGLAIPGIVVIILISVSLPKRNIFTLAFVIGLVAWFWVARAVRAQASSIRTREHIDVARLSGAGFWSILLRDVLPYLLSYVVMAGVLQVSGAILFESTLSMLGLGPANATSLGTMLYWAIAWGSVRTGAWWAFVPPTLMLTLIVFGLLLLQSSLNEVFNPRLRRGRAAKKKTAEVTAEETAGELEELEEPHEVGEAEHVGATGMLENPISAGGEHR